MGNSQPRTSRGEWLVTKETARIVEEHGLAIDVIVRDAGGQAVTGPELDALRAELSAHHARRDHARELTVVGNMAACVSHEARNLLTGILGFAQLLLTKSPRDDAEHNMLISIEQETRRCVELLSNYLQLSRPSNDTTTALRIEDLVRPVQRLANYPLQQRGCSLRVAIAPDLPTISGRGPELQRVLLNLIYNAVDSIDHDGVIELCASSRGDDAVELSVTDNGPGVPVLLRERIFDVFFSTKGTDQGTGLGLPLSRSIVEAHGGQLFLDEAHERGARFVVRLPAKPNSAGG